MDNIKKYQLWLEKLEDNSPLKSELEAIAGDEKEINDRFWRDLEFGTGGLRGIIGAGSNRMNLLTVGKVTQGLAEYLRANYTSPSVAIAYDTRNFSKEFALETALILCANGVRVYLSDSVRPVPMLSYFVREKKASAGVVITASHNPKEYNGYKVYGEDGGQITNIAAEQIIAATDRCDIFSGIKNMTLDQALEQDRFSYLTAEDDEGYYKKVESIVVNRSLVEKKAGELKLVYTPLHGAGLVPVSTMITRLGFTGLSIVEAQRHPDGSFPTVPYPNPEEPAVFKLAIAQAKETSADIILATDPDCDRIGVAVRDKSGEYTLINGNQMGVLLCDYIITSQVAAGTLKSNSGIIKTIVTSDMSRAICEKYSVTMFETLTGFKYIGELIGEWQESGEYTFLLGFEESYGYLAGDFVRDKDGVIAAVLIAEMALYHKISGKTLTERLVELYEEYGYFKESQTSIELKGEAGQQKISEIISSFREDYSKIFAGSPIKLVYDYDRSVAYNIISGVTESIVLPRSNVLKFVFTDGSWVTVRPSGTEPKLKLYFSAVGEKEAAADSRMAELKSLVEMAVKV